MKGGHPLTHTVCPNYGMLLIERWTLAVNRNRLRNGACSEVGSGIARGWEPSAAYGDWTLQRPVW